MILVSLFMLCDYVQRLEAKAFLEVACPDFDSYKVVYVNWSAVNIS